MTPTDTIYQGVPDGIKQMFDVAAGSRTQEAEWLAEDIKLLATRNPKITTQLFKVAVHHTNAGDLSDTKLLQALYGTLKQFVAEMTGGKYPTLLSLHYNDGLAEEGWEPPAHDMAQPTELETMRAEIHAMKQSPLISKEDLRTLPSGTTEQYTYLKNLIGNRATEMANMAEPVADDTEPLAVEPKPVEREMTAGEAIIERRKLMVQSMLNPSSASADVLAEAKALVKEGDVGIIMEMNRLTTDDVTIRTIDEALSYTAKMEGISADAKELDWPDPVPVIARASELAAEIRENAAGDAKPAKLTHRLKEDIRRVVTDICRENPDITLEALMTTAQYIAAAHAERDTPNNLFDRLIKAGAGIPWPPKALINVLEEPCQSVSTAETSLSSSSTPDSKPTESSVLLQEGSEYLLETPSTEPSNKPALLCQEKSQQSTMTTSSTPSETSLDEEPAAVATQGLSTGSTTSSESVETTASGSTTSHTKHTSVSEPTLSLSTLIEKRKTLEAQLAEVKTQIAAALAAEERELGDRLRAIEEAKRSLIDG